jgi:hypothetical protein
MTIFLFFWRLLRVLKWGLLFNERRYPTTAGCSLCNSPFPTHTHTHTHKHKSESELLYDWQFTANQFVLAPSPLRPTANIFFPLNTCGYSPYVTSSLTRRWVCPLQLLLGLASAVILRSESRRTHDHILLSQIRDFPNLDGQVLVFISPPEQGGPVIPPGTGFPFRRLLLLAGLRWRYSTPPPHEMKIFNPS